MFFKRKIIIFVYNAYIDGLSTEEIYFKLRLFKPGGYKMGKFDFNDINSIINDVNSILL